MRTKKTRRNKKSLSDRFWSKVDKLGLDDCWPWTAAKDSYGYGCIRNGDHTSLSHRVSWEIHNKQNVPKHTCVLHTCDNISCVNPAHLIIGQRAHPIMPYPERFWAKFDKRGSNECWPWTAGKDGHGYGRITDENGRVTGAHRMSWAIHNKRKVPEGMHVLHECDNPSCVNPKHLWLGDHSDNMRDMVAKNRRPHGERHPNVKLNNKKVLKMRAMYKAGDCTMLEIGTIFGVTQTTVRAIVNHKTWKHL